MAQAKKIGVIGTGDMGARHARNLAHQIKGADVQGLMDISRERSEPLAKDCGEALLFDDAHELINDATIDALIIASPDPTHAGLALACLEAGKPVLLEKPLAIDLETAKAVVEAEAKSGKKFITLGFMRVYDKAHLAVKDILERGELGAPLMFRGVHNNVAPGRRRTVEDVAINSAVHDFHSACWLMQSEIRTVTARYVPASASEPDSCRLLLIQLTFENGALGTIEVNADSGYGYEVLVEITGENGLVRSADHANAIEWRGRTRSVDIPPDWLIRFERAYLDEIQAWVQSLHEGSTQGPTAWDGYRSLTIADAVVKSIGTCQSEPVKSIARPTLYVS